MQLPLWLLLGRVQCWALLLGAYNYSNMYKPGKQHANADMLSRLLLPQAPEHIPVPPETIHLMDTLNSSPVTAAHIKQWTTKDPMLSKVKDLVLRGHYGRRRRFLHTTGSGRNSQCKMDVYSCRHTTRRKRASDGAATLGTSWKLENERIGTFVRLVAWNRS